MQSFVKLYEQAAARKGGTRALDKLIGKPRTPVTVSIRVALPSSRTTTLTVS